MARWPFLIFTRYHSPPLLLRQLQQPVLVHVAQKQLPGAFRLQELLIIGREQVVARAPQILLPAIQ